MRLPAYADLNEAGDSGFSESESGAGTNEPKGSWRVDSHGWWYELANGSYPRSQWLDLGGTWYWFDAGGYMVTGWAPVGGGWYYFDSSGAMATGWRYLDGSWYYLRDSGAMATGWFIGRRNLVLCRCFWCHADRLAQPWQDLVLPGWLRSDGYRLAGSQWLLVLHGAFWRHEDGLALAG